ncbi:MAG TPA: Sua5/YciO/YrdC/YwlC family protein [Candidatus Poseidoniales archaeon]|nr:MAG TPA: Sua5/YciO/YrdC/YwlC family protein [Candidatus Poseidoniales archaeon]
MNALQNQIDWILSGGLCVYPTTTQPALGCLPSPENLNSLFSIKKRSHDKPVSIGAVSLEQASDYVMIPTNLESFLSHFERGAITVLLPAKKELDSRLGTQGVAVRILDHPMARELVRQTGPLSATSANMSGTDPLTSCSDAALELGGRDAGIDWIDAICPGGLPSTLISWPLQIGLNASRAPKILREGIIPIREVMSAWKNPI